MNSMNEQYIALLSSELHLPSRQVQAAVQLLEDGATIPFIARYRKEATGSLNETAITAIRERLEQLEALDKRRATVLKSLEDQNKLSGELRAKIFNAETLAVLEDLYLPFRPKRRTRASVAREKGLEPLAHLLLAQDSATNPGAEANPFINPDMGVSSSEEALAGARDIVAEWVSEDTEARARLRALFNDHGIIRSRVVSGKESEGIRYRDYYDWEGPLGKAPSHRILAVRRGEKEGFLTVHIGPPEERALSALEGLFVKGDGTAASREVKTAVHDSYKRLLQPSLETEAKQWSKERADREAIQIFVDNLRHLLMAPPLGPRRVMAIDPGFRTGCKVVCLDPQGKLIHSETIYPHSGAQSSAKAAERIESLAAAFSVEAMAIGNGTAGRETESFVRNLSLPPDIQVIMVDESGASVYSASSVAREEFPEHDLTVRGAVSIGRRLTDPLAELVKIDPKAIGVGQYQHDVDQSALKRSLDDTVMSCVNAVGVEVNTASPHLLAYVSGLGPQLAKNIVAYRNDHGPFGSREEFKKVPRLGPKAFQQGAGFLRIRDGKNPLDASAVHPEAYSIVERMSLDLGCSVGDLMHQVELRQTIDPTRYLTEEAGLPTLQDILAELAKPGRDPRETFEAFSFAPGIEKVADLRPGLKLPGIVTNVTAFGAFVDIGVHRDGLVHVSELSDHFVSDPRQVVRVHQPVMVTVLEVDLERSRISLSMKSSSAPRAEPPKTKESAPTKKRADQGKPALRTGGFNNPFEAALKKP
jgi:protein Tex